MMLPDKCKNVMNIDRPENDTKCPTDFIKCKMTEDGKGCALTYRDEKVAICRNCNGITG